jgi:cytochrome c553
MLMVLMATAAAAIAPPAWLYPQNVQPAEAHAGTTTVQVAGSKVRVPESALHDRARTINWFPGDQPPPPAIVLAAPPGGFACGYCHMANGVGHPQNNSIAGLPEAYVINQFAAFRAGQRKAALPGYIPNNSMTRVATMVSDADIAATARYYSKLPYRSLIRVREVALAPRVAAVGLVWTRVEGAPEPIDGRIVELMDRPDDSILHNPRGRITAYVPPGSIARGRAIDAELGCMACHREQMAGWGPGRSPSYIVRQLLAFRNRTRTSPGAETMHGVADQLGLDDMVAVAAWMGAGAKG